MRRKIILVVTVIALAVSVKSGEAGIFKSIGNAVISVGKEAAAVVSPRIKINNKLGYDFEGHNLSIVNGTNFWVRIIVSRKEVAVLPPGGIAYDNRHWEPLAPEIPIIALFYRDLACSSMGYLGVAKKEFRISHGGSRPNSWVIKTNEIEGPDGRRLSNQQGIYPAGQISQKEPEKVKFPREWWNATSVVQIVNNTYFPATIFLNGNRRATIETGEVLALTAVEILGDGAELVIQAVFENHGLIAGTAEKTFRIPKNSVRAEQIVLSTRDIKR